MTIIKPHKSRSFKGFLALLFAVLAMGGGLYIYEYNALVNTRSELLTLKAALPEAQAANAGLKNQFYTMLDPGQLQTLGQKDGLTLDKKPQYLKLNPWVSVSTY